METGQGLATGGNDAPARWSAEAYDAVGLIARAAGTTGGSDAKRAGTAQRLFLLTHRGITRTFSIGAPHKVRAETGIFLCRAEDGRARFLGPRTRV